MIDCALTNLPWYQNQCNQGPSFGSLFFTYAQNTGLVLDSNYPYTAKQSTCRIKSYTKMYMKIGGSTTINSQKAFNAAITKQPIFGVVYPDSKFMLYRSGLLTNKQNGKSYGSNYDFHQGVTIVAYNSTEIKIRVSYSSYWGIQGYARIDTTMSANTASNYFYWGNSSLQVPTSIILQ